MKKRGISLILIFAVVCTIPIVANAEKLRWNSNSIGIGFSGGSVICSAVCLGDSTNDELSATMTLYKNNSYVDSWSRNGTGDLSFSGEYKNAAHGKTYKLTLTWSINGVSQPSVSTERYYA